VLIQIKEQIRAIPHGGIGYGLLRYIGQNQEVRQQLAGLPQSEIVFNYRGRSASMLDEDALLVPANDVSGFALHPDSPRTHLIAFEGQVIDDHLRITVAYSEQCYHLTTIEQLLEWYREALRAIIMHCRAQQEEHFTPQDFPEADLDQSELDSILASVYDEMES
jgi:microcystin synthetase protein McyA